MAHDKLVARKISGLQSGANDTFALLLLKCGESVVRRIWASVIFGQALHAMLLLLDDK